MASLVKVLLVLCRRRACILCAGTWDRGAAASPPSPPAPADSPSGRCAEYAVDLATRLTDADLYIFTDGSGPGERCGSHPDGVSDLSGFDLNEIAAALADPDSYERAWLINPDTGEIVFWTCDTGIDGQTPVDLGDLAEQD